ncbi:hypothetical protein SLU01_18990 [Sporosarcina luteola]|uniref:HTH cro/C1-type domain-containing protein n=1 Tax=Sporosarcina luteola TaxID=582850 RepID=A0A511Z821_9BACL|nr:helix-turn-helix transcriptional regulator [Sporosarcina luteola]GEN83587.1 hypothetical protein SLU01_18990 [Sporosarcina luteola]
MTIPVKEFYLYGSDIQNIGSNVSSARLKKEFTQLQLAQRLGYKSASFISRLELWETEKLSHKQLEQIADCLDVPVRDLLQVRY